MSSCHFCKLSFKEGVIKNGKSICYSCAKTFGSCPKCHIADYCNFKCHSCGFQKDHRRCNNCNESVDSWKSVGSSAYCEPCAKVVPILLQKPGSYATQCFYCKKKTRVDYSGGAGCVTGNGCSGWGWRCYNCGERDDHIDYD